MRRSVVVGPSEIEGWVEIVEGLRAGERVVLDRRGLDPGALIRVQEPEQDSPMEPTS